MSKLFISMLLFCSFSHAQDNSVPTEAPTSNTISANGSKEFDKLSYLPDEGSFQSDLNLLYTTSQVTIKGPAGTVADIKGTTTTFGYQLDYGLSEYLSLNIAGSVLISSKSDYSYGAGSTLNGQSKSYKSEGWAEPILGATWRVRDNEQSKLRIHLLGGVRPKMQTAKYATEDSKGNAGIGGTQFFLGASIFKEVKNLEFEFSFAHKFDTVAKSEDSSDSNKTTEADEHRTSIFGLEVLGKSSDEFSLGGALLFESVGSYTVDSFTGTIKGTPTAYDSYTASTIKLLGRYKIEETSIAKFEIENVLSYSRTAKIGTIKADQNVQSGYGFTVGWVQGF